MAHIKKRTNTIIKVYKFGAKPLEELPVEFWETAKQMQFIWNDLVHMRNKLTENFDRLGISGKDKVKDRIEYWKEFDKIWKSYLKSNDVKSRLGGDEREFLMQKFETADKAAKKNKTGLRKRYGLDRVYFRHRYSGGGKPLADFQKQNSKGFSFLFPTYKPYESDSMQWRRKRIGAGVFGCVKDREQVFSFPFSAVIHREIPENAIVKSVSWVGKHLKNRGYKGDWIWSIDVSVEIENEAPILSQVGRAVSLDVGWRKKDDFLKIGAMLDSDGNKLEIKLPINFQSNNAKDGKLVSSISGLMDLSEDIGNLVQSTKDELSKLGVKNLTKMRENGLFRMMRESENEQVLQILENFKNQYIPLSSCRVRSFDRMNKYRDWLYQNIASWLAENYDCLIWEGKLNLKKIAETKKNLNEVETFEENQNEKRRRLSAKYRGYASIYSFREYLKKAFDKQGKPIIDGVTAYSSRTCSDCGEIVEKFIDEEFVCPNGHEMDRDFNACQNLLNQIQDFEFVKGKGLQIPDEPNRNLSKVVVKVE